MTLSAVLSHAGYRFPAEIISHAVWLPFRIPLRMRIVDELSAVRGTFVIQPTGLHDRSWP